MIRNSLFLLLIVSIISCSVYQQEVTVLNKTTILKTNQFEELDSLLQIEKRPIFIFFHTDWCKYCENMKQTSFKDKAVIEILNQNYYFVSFNGEEQKAINFNGRWFEYIPNGKNSGMHELCTGLAEIDGVLNYPSLVLLNTKYEIIFQYAAFLNNKELLVLLQEGLK